jgi:hypothetical protein
MSYSSSPNMAVSSVKCQVDWHELHGSYQLLCVHQRFLLKCLYFPNWHPAFEY